MAAKVSLDMFQQMEPKTLTWPSIVKVKLRSHVAKPINCLHNFAQKYRVPLFFRFTDHEDSSPGHGITFTCRVTLGKTTYPPASASSKKQAKRDAYRNVLMALNYHRLYEFKRNLKDIDICTLHDIIAKLCYEKFDRVIEDIPNNLTKWKVIAGIVMESKSDRIFEVISLASGSRFITGKSLTTNGKVLIDSHAEILTARGMRRFLYHHIRKLCQGQRSNVLQRNQNGKFQLVSGIKFHLYISTVPCGDGAKFSRGCSVLMGDNDGHMPVFKNKNQGRLKMKTHIHATGQCPTVDRKCRNTYQSKKEIRCGNQLRVMSCSDKICKWNLLGVQGALLANLMEPVYLTSITLGFRYKHGHIARAMCCRLVKTQTIENLPSGYKVNHPLLGGVSHKKTPQCRDGKSTPYCINWNRADDCHETTDGSTGLLHNRELTSSTGLTERKSRLCKQELLKFYCAICSDVGTPSLVKGTYWSTKKASTQYQSCRKILYTALHNQGYGTWVGVPVECQEFSTQFSPSFYCIHASSMFDRSNYY
ncbi:double-stranded RNA-specific adenosine deaminase-like isoform X2 [Argopecten irradians]